MNQLPNTQTFDDFLEHYGVKGMKWGKVKSSDLFTNYDLSYLSDEERKKVIDEMAKAAAGGASPKEVEKIIEDAANKSKQKSPGSITVSGKTYTAEEWKAHSKKEAARLKKERDNHWTKKVNDFAKSLGLKEDIFTTKTTYSSDEKVEVLKHSDQFNDFLEHYGVLGMKWGVRKDDRSPRLGAASISDSAEQMKIVTSYGDNPNRKSLSRKDYRKTERALGNFRKAMTTDGPEFNKFLGEIAKVNQKYEKSGLYGSDYYKDLSTSLTKQVRGLIADEPNADAFVVAQYGQGRTRHDIDLYFGDKDFVSEFLDTYASDMPYLKHEGVDISRLTFKAIVDDNGKVLTVEPAVESVITHSDLTFDDFLEHYGVLGMKWGVRKDRPNSRLPKHATFYNTDKATGATTMVDYNPRKVQVSRVAGGGIQVTGRSQKEVKRVSEEIRRQLSNKSEKKSVTSKLNLTDDELRSTINRMQLEKTYAQLTATPKQSNAMQQFMVNTGSQILGNAITNVGTEYLKQFLKVNIDKNIKPEFRISKIKTDKK